MFEAVTEQALTAMSLVAAALILAILRRVLQKLGISLSAERDAQLEYAVAEGIARAKEAAAAQIKAYGTSMPAEQKLEIAREHVKDTLKKVDPVKVDAKIESTLAKVGEGATVPKG